MQLNLRDEPAIGFWPDILIFASNISFEGFSGKCQNVRPDTKAWRQKNFELIIVSSLKTFLRLGLGVRPDILTFATNAFQRFVNGKYQNIRPDTNGISISQI